MNRPEFVRIFAKKTNRRINDTVKFLDDFEKILLETLASGNDILFHDFCKFEVKHVKRFERIHPKNSNRITIEAKYKPYMKFGKRFRETILNSKEVIENRKKKEKHQTS